MTQSQTMASSPATDPPAPVRPLQGHPTSGHSTLSHHQVPANTNQMAVLPAAALTRETADLAESYGALGPPLFGVLKTVQPNHRQEGQMTEPT